MTDTPTVAALAPDLHKDLWAKYSGVIPHDSVIREYLLWERNFNPDNIDRIIRQFRETIAYANLTSSDEVDSSSDDGSPNYDESETQNTQVAEIKSSAEKILDATTLPTGRIFKASIEVLADGALDVIFAGSMNATTIALLKDIYDLKKKYEPEAEAIGGEETVGDETLP